MEISHSLIQEIVELVSSIPGIEDPKTRTSLVFSAGLESELQRQIDFSGPVSVFVRHLIHILVGYGMCIDGRHALEAILVAVKDLVGLDKRNHCHALQQKLYTQLHPQAEGQPLSLSRVQLILEGDIYANETKRNDLLTVIAALLDINKTDVHISEIRQNTVSLELSHEYAVEFVTLSQAESPKIEPFVEKFQPRSGFFLSSDSETAPFPKRVSHTFFIRRNRELQDFIAFISPDSQAHLLVIHTNGEGGVGKTKLLEQMLTICKARPDDIVCTKNLVDFYQTECRSRLGVLDQIARNVGYEYFPHFRQEAEAYRQEKDTSKRDKKLSTLKETFEREYVAFSESHKGYLIVLFLDTYERIQRIAPESGDGKTYAESTGLSSWLETELLPDILEKSLNTRIVVSGRYPLRKIGMHLQKGLMRGYLLPHFRIDDTAEFLQAQLQCTYEELVEKLGSAEILDKIQMLSQGHPILLALVVDWINYKPQEEPFLSPQALVTEIEETIAPINASTSEKIRRLQYDLFERRLIEKIQALENPENVVVLEMAIAYHRMTPQLLCFLEESIDTEQSKEYFHNLQQLSFIKPKTEGTLLLHDEMRRMMVRWLDKYYDESRIFRRAVAAKLVEYYDTLLASPNLSEAEREVYTAEQLEYKFLEDPERGLETFRITFGEDFDTLMEDGLHDYCDMLLRDFEMYRHENQEVIPFPDSLEIDWRRMSYNNELVTDIEETLQMAKAILKKHETNSEFTSRPIYAQILLQKGIAEFWLEQFQDAEESLNKAYKAFYDTTDDEALLHLCHNWLGYIYYRQSQFHKAETHFEQSRDGFFNLLTTL